MKVLSLTEPYDTLFKNIEVLDNPIKAKGYLGIWDFII